MTYLSRGLARTDFAHHIGTTTHTLAPACRYLYKEKNRKKSVFDIFTQVRCLLGGPLKVETYGWADAGCRWGRESHVE